MKATSLPSARSGFTLIELLVVVAIMAMLMTLIGGGIRKSMDSAKKRQAATARQSVQAAIMTYWHDTGKPPIETQKGYYVYVYDWSGKARAAKVSATGTITNVNDAVTEVLEPLANPSHKRNPLQKTYLSGNDQYVKSITRIKFDLTAKNATVE